MKKALAILLAAVLLPGLVACGPQGPQTLPGSGIVLREIDISTDTLLPYVVARDTDFVMEKSIFQPLMALNAATPFATGDTVTIPCADSWQRVTLYDHLLREDGSSWFNRTIREYELVPENGAITISLDTHMGAHLSSDGEFLKDGSLRGFRMVVQEADEVTEYAFVLHVQ